MRIFSGRRRVVGCVGCLLASLAALLVLEATRAPRARAEDGAADAALARTREQAKMLDTLYKNAVIAVNELYESPPAVKVAKRVFAAMEKGGHHSVRLVDATGSPMSEDNLPRTDFEKRAEKKMQEGETYYEEVTGTGDSRRLLVATLVPAVHSRCARCHGVKEGEILGFLRYDLPVK